MNGNQPQSSQEPQVDSNTDDCTSPPAATSSTNTSEVSDFDPRPILFKMENKLDSKTNEGLISDGSTDIQPVDATFTFIVEWNANDRKNPKNMPSFHKWVVVIILSLSCACFTCTSSIYASSYPQITAEFNCSELVATLGLSLYVFGMGLGPMLFGGLSEYLGRRNIYIASYSLFIIWLVPCAVAHNIGTILAARFLAGLSGSAFLSVAGGSVVDMFSPTKMRVPMMIFTASPFIGPELGPLIGGFINDNTNWRWSFYTMIIWAGTLLLMIIIIVPETYSPVLLSRQAKMLRVTTGDDRWRTSDEPNYSDKHQALRASLYVPFKLLVTEPKCLALCIYTAFLLGIIYLFFGAFVLVFEDVYQFSASRVGLSFLGLLVGMTVAVLLEPYLYQTPFCHTSLGKEQDPSVSEIRLYPSLYGSILVPIGLFWFAWTIKPSVHYIVPIIGSTVFAIGTLLVYIAVFAFLVAEYPAYAASALSANAFLRCTFAAAFPLFGIQFYTNVGYSWATSIIASVTVVMAIFPYLFFKFGKRLK